METLGAAFEDAASVLGEFHSIMVHQMSLPCEALGF